MDKKTSEIIDIPLEKIEEAIAEMNEYFLNIIKSEDFANKWPSLSGNYQVQCIINSFTIIIGTLIGSLISEKNQSVYLAKIIKLLVYQYNESRKVPVEEKIDE